MNKAYLLTGGNLGNRQENLETARRLIEIYCGKILKASLVYETAAWGNTDQPLFLNQALEIETKWSAVQLIRRILKIEKNMGRVRKERMGPRIIDIDILFFNEEKYNHLFLQIPHPELHNRRFALLPLSEIAPELKHPVYHKTITELLQGCPDQLPVYKL